MAERLSHRLPGPKRSFIALKDAGSGIPGMTDPIIPRLLEASPEIIFVVNARTGVFEFLNPAFEMITGWEASKWIGQSFEKIIHAPDLPLAQEIFRKLGCGEPVEPVVIRVLSRSGSYHYIEAIAKHDSSGGRPEKLFGFGRDITSRHLSERQLRLEYEVTQILSHARTVGEVHYLVLQAIAQIFAIDWAELWAMDHRQSVLRCAATWANGEIPVSFQAEGKQLACVRGMGLAGQAWAAEEPVEIKSFSRAAGFLRPRTARAAGFRTAFAFPILLDGRAEAVLAFFRKGRHPEDGHWKPLLLNISKQISLFGEQKRSYEVLSRTEAEYRRIIDSVSDYVWSAERTASGEFSYKFYSKAVERITGRPPSFFLAGQGQWLSTVHADDRERMSRIASQILNGAVESAEAEYRIVLPNGKIRWVRDSATATRMANGSTRLDGVVSDISERKQIEQTLRELPQKILDAQESERKRVARELHDGVGQILGSIKFRVTSIQEAAGVSKDLLRETAELRELLETAIVEVDRISMKLRPSQLDDFGLFTAVKSLCDAFAKRNGIRLVLKLPRREWKLNPEAEMCAYRVIQEGLNNVEKHAGAGEVQVALRRRGLHFAISVRDNGKGFDAAAAPKRGGMGLIGVQERMTLNGGTFRLATSPRGTKLTMSLPAK